MPISHFLEAQTAHDWFMFLQIYGSGSWNENRCFYLYFQRRASGFFEVRRCFVISNSSHLDATRTRIRIQYVGLVLRASVTIYEVPSPTDIKLLTRSAFYRIRPLMFAHRRRYVLYLELQTTDYQAVEKNDGGTLYRRA